MACKAKKSLPELKQCSPSSCICLCFFYPHSPRVVFVPVCDTSEAHSTLPFHLGSPGFGLFIGQENMSGISRFREVKERNNRREQLASKEEIICQIMSLALPGIISFVLEDQQEKGRSAGSAVFVRKALCWDSSSTEGPCLSW